MRGENFWRVESLMRPKGTSPHAWGRRGLEQCSNQPVGNVPTCVGKTYHAEQNVRGTSPHAWGRHQLVVLRLQSLGNIPTYVGKTLIMLSKIKYLTFRKVPNLLTFDDFQKQRERQNHILKVPKLNDKTFFSSVFKASATNLSSRTMPLYHIKNTRIKIAP